MPDVSPDGQSSVYSYGATGAGPSAVELVDRALERMSAELDPLSAAANLLKRWVEHDSSLLPLLPDAMRDLEAREKRSQTRGGKVKHAKGPVRVGDFAFIASGLGPTFYVVRKVHVDEAGKVIAVTLGDPSSNNSGQPVAIERITAIFTNILNNQE